ncbi:MAG TPA: alpha/beta hydrolase [Spirochaetota bacterium]|nr:alpha/beta hydrolase [Spirochaetota bacterium]HPP51016.1 alpha/beta hydrolase [Spirochaetota bacterium]
MKKVLIVFVAIIIALIAIDAYQSHITYTYTPKKLPATFDEYYQMKLKESKEKGARPHNEEKLLKFADKTKIAMLYIHGYGASRGEGEYVIDTIAKKLKYNTYYLRLPGHGTTMDDHKSTEYYQLLDTAIEAAHMTKLLGEKLVIIGTSMGGTIATYIAAEHPDIPDAVILVSPFYRFANPVGNALLFRPFFKTVLLFAKYRERHDPYDDPNDNWTMYWYAKNYWASLHSLLDMSDLIARDDVYRKVSCPVLLLYYYKDNEHKDGSAQVEAMLEAYDIFNNGKPNPLSRKIAVEDGDHVLLSKYVKSDWGKAEKAITDFLNDIAQ